MWQLSTILAQSSAVPTDPGTLGLYGGGALGIAWLFGQMLRPFIEAGAAALKRRFGDRETTLKDRTRHLVETQSEYIADIRRDQRQLAEAMSRLAETQRETVKEIEEMRRESRTWFERLERAK